MNRGRRRILQAAAALPLAAAAPQFLAGTGLGPTPARASDGQFIGGAEGCSRLAIIFNIGAGFEPALGIMDTLASYGTPTTAFFMGWWVDAQPEAARAIVSYGHPIGSHGNEPPELTLRSDAEIRADIWGAEEAFVRVLGEPPGPWFTTFAGATDARVNAVIAELGYTPVGWEIDTGDWTPETSADDIYNRVMADAHDGAIIQMHLDSEPSSWTTAVALPRLIEDLSAEGYTFVTIPDMMQSCS